MTYNNIVLMRHARNDATTNLDMAGITADCSEKELSNSPKA